MLHSMPCFAAGLHSLGWAKLDCSLQDPVKRLTNLLIDSFERPVVINHVSVPGHGLHTSAPPGAGALRGSLGCSLERMPAAGTTALRHSLWCCADAAVQLAVFVCARVCA